MKSAVRSICFLRLASTRCSLAALVAPSDKGKKKKNAVGNGASVALCGEARQ